jgi:hypothetical protein
MKKYIIAGLVVATLIGIIVLQRERMKVIENERTVFRQNTYSLLEEIERYQTKEKLNAVSINQLELKLSEVNKYRSENMKLIESLKVDKKRLQQITSAQTQTIYELQGAFSDSIVYVDNFITDTLSCININEKWFDLRGCVDANSKFAGRFENRDSLLYVEHIVPNRFWFIRWGVKERRQEIVSRNPHTKITGAEFISIRK